MPDEFTAVRREIPTACFAPPLTDEKLAHYRELIDALPDSPIKSAMDSCYKAVAAWWELPESADHDDDPSWMLRYRGKQVSIRLKRLDPEIRDKVWDATPWEYELQAMQSLFDSIDPVSQKELRDAAYHLLWFATELALGREPLTKDKLV